MYTFQIEYSDYIPYQYTVLIILIYTTVIIESMFNLYLNFLDIFIFVF